MAAEDTGPDTLVSVQDARASDAVRGHLAWGRLVHGDYVVLHGRPRWLRRDVDLEALLAVPDPVHAVRSERVRISQVQLRGIIDRPDLEFTGVRLERPSALPAASAWLTGIFEGAGSDEENLRSMLTVLEQPPSPDGLLDAAGVLETVAVQEQLERFWLLEDQRMSLPGAPDSSGQLTMESQRVRFWLRLIGL